MLHKLRNECNRQCVTTRERHRLGCFELPDNFPVGFSIKSQQVAFRFPRFAGGVDNLFNRLVAAKLRACLSEHAADAVDLRQCHRLHLAERIVEAKFVANAPLQRCGSDRKRARLGQGLCQDRVVVTLAGAVSRD